MSHQLSLSITPNMSKRIQLSTEVITSHLLSELQTPDTAKAVIYQLMKKFDINPTTFEAGKSNSHLCL